MNKAQYKQVQFYFAITANAILEVKLPLAKQEPET